MIKKVKKEKTVTKVLTPAIYKDVKTDKVRDVTVVKDGVERTEERPVYERVFFEQTTEDAIIEYDVWEVDDGDDVHEFTTEEDAKKFLGSKK